MIAIIDYGAGNIKSIEKAFEFLGEKAIVTCDNDEILSCSAFVLPGVGAFGDAMGQLRKSGLDKTVYKAVETGRPFLGICLGLQLLFESSEEADGVCGLGILKGTIDKIPDKGLKIPHMGWNSIEILKPKLFSGCIDPYVYFVHSYFLNAKDKSIVSARADYGITFDAAVECGNIFATQFHPEKSGKVGLSMLQNFIKEIK